MKKNFRRKKPNKNCPGITRDYVSHKIEEYKKSGGKITRIEATDSNFDYKNGRSFDADSADNFLREQY